MKQPHGGGLDAACARWGGARTDWLDLSTGINPEPFPLPALPPDAWTALPDRDAYDGLIAAARAFWRVPDGAAVLPASGLSAVIAALPGVMPHDVAVDIPGPTYSEHGLAFRRTHRIAPDGAVRVLVHPNNPDGRMWDADALDGRRFGIVDESFCDVMPERSLIALAARPGRVVLKSFGKFWGLAGLRVGFAIGDPDLLRALSDRMGPWAVSGPALAIGTAALRDGAWAKAARRRLARDAARLDGLMAAHGRLVGGTALFRLYDCDAGALRDRLAARRIWSRAFDYDPRWLRLGLPPGSQWARLEAALV